MDMKKINLLLTALFFVTVVLISSCSLFVNFDDITYGVSEPSVSYAASSNSYDTIFFLLTDNHKSVGMSDDDFRALSNSFSYYFTIDGTEPSPENYYVKTEDSVVSVGSIRLEDNNDVYSYTIKYLIKIKNNDKGKTKTLKGTVDWKTDYRSPKTRSSSLYYLYADKGLAYHRNYPSTISSSPNVTIKYNVAEAGKLYYEVFEQPSAHDGSMSITIKNGTQTIPYTAGMEVSVGTVIEVSTTANGWYLSGFHKGFEFGLIVKSV